MYLKHAEYVKHFKAIPTMIDSVVKAIVSIVYLCAAILTR